MILDDISNACIIIIDPFYHIVYIVDQSNELLSDA